MNAKFLATNPDEIMMTAEFTMPLKDWMAIHRAIVGGTDANWRYPFSDFLNIIKCMAEQAKKNFYPDESEK